MEQFINKGKQWDLENSEKKYEWPLGPWKRQQCKITHTKIWTCGSASSRTWMSQEVSKWLGSMGYNPQYIPFLCRWNNPLILSSTGRIQVGTGMNKKTLPKSARFGLKKPWLPIVVYMGWCKGPLFFWPKNQWLWGPYKWPYKWVSVGLFHPYSTFLSGFLGPPCTKLCFPFYSETVLGADISPGFCSKPVFWTTWELSWCMGGTAILNFDLLCTGDFCVIFNDGIFQNYHLGRTF